MTESLTNAEIDALLDNFERGAVLPDPTLQRALLELRDRREADKCPKCEGTGKFVYGREYDCELSTTCPACNGTGKSSEATLRAEVERLRDALTGLLPLCEKMFGMLEETARRGLSTMKPAGLKFDDLKFVKLSRAALSAPAEPKTGCQIPDWVLAIVGDSGFVNRTPSEQSAMDWLVSALMPPNTLAVIYDPEAEQPEGKQ